MIKEGCLNAISTEEKMMKDDYSATSTGKELKKISVV